MSRTTSSYMQSHVPSVIKSHASRSASNTCRYFSHLLKPNFDILDAGCGPGSITSSLAHLVSAGSIIGIDTTESVLEQARNRPDLPSNCTFKLADMTALPFAEASFDVVHTSQALTHVPDVLTAMRELYRVCKPGGFLACREGDTSGILLYPMHPGLVRYKEVNLQMIGHGTAGRQLLRWAIDAGCAASSIEYTIDPFTYTGEQRLWWGQSMAARVVEDRVWRQKVVDAGVAKEEDFELMGEGWKAFLDDEAALFSLPCGQIVAYK